MATTELLVGLGVLDDYLADSLILIRPAEARSSLPWNDERSFPLVRKDTRGAFGRILYPSDLQHPLAFFC